jgi:hypothetical protein
MPARYVRHPMTRVLVRPWWLASLLTACVPGVSPGPAPRERGDEAVAEPPAASAPLVVAREGPLEVELDGASPSPPIEALTRMPGRDEASAHAERAAWSADGRTFVHCRTLPGLDCSECRFVARDGTAQSLESGPGCGDTAIPRATLDARLAEAELAPPVARWRDGADVLLVVETREQETTNAGRPRPMLKLGARRRDGGPAAWLLHVDPCQGCGTDQVCAAAAHLDALALSPDGGSLAVLIHQRGTQGDESLRVELLAPERVAAAARAPASRATP